MSPQGCAQAVSDAGLQPLLDAVWSGEVSGSQLSQCLEKTVLSQWWDWFFAQEPLLAEFEGTEHQSIINKFRELDTEAMVLAQRLIRARLSGQVPSLQDPGEEPPVLRKQLSLQRRHMAIRKLFTKIPVMFKRLKPCVLMSPLSVAQYLEPTLDGFDVVIFDEASQIPPWDAVGAIARGTQVVIVGDPATSAHDLLRPAGG